VEVRILIGQTFPFDLGPDHERVHRPPDPLLLLFPLRVPAPPVVTQVVVLDSVADERVDAATLATHQAGVVVGVVPPGEYMTRKT